MKYYEKITQAIKFEISINKMLKHKNTVFKSLHGKSKYENILIYGNAKVV